MQENLTILKKLRDEGYTNKEVEKEMNWKEGYAASILLIETKRNNPEKLSTLLHRKDSARMKALIADIFKTSTANVHSRIKTYTQKIAKFPEEAITIDMNDPWFIEMCTIYSKKKST